MAEEIKRKYKYCIVPHCTSTSVTAPDKVFISLPTDVKARRLWQKAMRRTDYVGNKSNLVVCEDHFNVSTYNLELICFYSLIGVNTRRCRTQEI